MKTPAHDAGLACCRRVMVSKRWREGKWQAAKIADGRRAFGAWRISITRH
jgi:hypothetical protein